MAKASDPTDPEEPDDLALLQFSHTIRDYHHNALWEIQKHYTWLLSIVLAAAAAILTTTVIVSPEREYLLTSLSALGFVLAVLALRAVRTEGKYFFDWNTKFVEYRNGVFSEDMPPPARVNLTMAALCTPTRLGVRDTFQLTCIAFAIVFVALPIYLFGLSMRSGPVDDGSTVSQQEIVIEPAPDVDR